MSNSGGESWRRRIALQITAQLPDSPEDAIAILDIARRLVGFIAEVGVCLPKEDQERVLPFRAGSGRPSSSRAR